MITFNGGSYEYRFHSTSDMRNSDDITIITLAEFVTCINEYDQYTD